MNDSTSPHFKSPFEERMRESMAFKENFLRELPIGSEVYFFVSKWIQGEQIKSIETRGKQWFFRLGKKYADGEGFMKITVKEKDGGWIIVDQLYGSIHTEAYDVFLKLKHG